MIKDTYWEKLGEGGFYQMGEADHRMILLELIQHYADRTMLDVGCGTGPLYEIIKNYYMPIDYKGVDYTHAFINTCKKEFPEGNWEVQDARKLKEKDSSFDAVVLMHALDHVDDYLTVLKEAKRVAKNHVYIILWRPFVEGDRSNLNSTGRMDNKNYEDTHLIDFSKAELDAAIDEAGLVIMDDSPMDTERYNYLYVLEA